LNVDEGLLAIVAMLLEFIINISFLVSIAVGVCILMKVVIRLKFEEATPLEDPFRSLKGRLRLRDGVKVMSVLSMRLYHLFKTFQLVALFIPKTYHITMWLGAITITCTITSVMFVWFFHVLKS
jgi:hypothetical protein